MNATVIAETFRRQVLSGGFIVFVILTTLMALVAATLDRPVAMWPSMIGLLTLILGCQLIGPEFTTGTLQLILAKPIGRSTYLLSRATGIVLAIAAAACLPAAAELIGRVVDGTASDHWRVIAATAANLALNAILTCGLLALFGSMTRSYVNIALYLVIMAAGELALSAIGALVNLGPRSGILGALAAFFAENVWISKAITKMNQNLFPEMPRSFDGDWTLLVLSNASAALLLACLTFRRREVPYGAD